MARRVLRYISPGLFIGAIIFVCCILANPGLGSVFYIGSFKLDVTVMRIFYAGYAIVMVLLFILSFVIKEKPKT